MSSTPALSVGGCQICIPRSIHSWPQSTLSPPIRNLDLNLYEECVLSTSNTLLSYLLRNSICQNGSKTQPKSHWNHFTFFVPQIGVASLPPPSPQCSPEVEDLFRQGFQLEPTKRATAKELLKHKAFVAGADNHILQEVETHGLYISSPLHDRSLFLFIGTTFLKGLDSSRNVTIIL